MRKIKWVRYLIERVILRLRLRVTHRRRRRRKVTDANAKVVAQCERTQPCGLHDTQLYNPATLIGATVRLIINSADHLMAAWWLISRFPSRSQHLWYFLLNKVLNLYWWLPYYNTDQWVCTSFSVPVSVSVSFFKSSWMKFVRNVQNKLDIVRDILVWCLEYYHKKSMVPNDITIASVYDHVTLITIDPDSR